MSYPGSFDSVEERTGRLATSCGEQHSWGWPRLLRTVSTGLKEIVMRLYLSGFALTFLFVCLGCESEKSSTTPPPGSIDGNGSDEVSADAPATDTPTATDTPSATDTPTATDTPSATDIPAVDVPVADLPAGDANASLSWFTTCGDPVCSGYSAPDPPIDMCAALSVSDGDACTVEGQLCDPMDSCNAQLICASADPKDGEEGCPKSRRAFKTDIAYVSAAERDALAKELLTMPLARWRYVHEGAETPAHLGFIIEDVEPSHAVQSRRDRVDLYGFTAMAVATIQAQQRKIEALEQKLKRLESLVVSGD